MAIITDFHQLKAFHHAAMVGGRGSKAWVEFAEHMMDSFPALYRNATATAAIARKMKTLAEEMRKDLP
ncbi:hypothetical protein [Herbaspirillum huttiense]|uniref:hypothetical protein n=1 Tax=Herbaspirillum huttiense TaxID=863372 RepID=UPI0039AF8A7E